MNRRPHLAVILSIVFASACAPSMLGTALAQDRGSWSAASTMPSGTGDSGVVALDGKIYVVGGSTFRAHILPTSSDMGSGTWGSTVNYEYDPATDRWRERAPLPIGLSYINLVALNHKIYTFGGFTNLVHADAQKVAAGIAWRDVRVANCTRRVVKTESPPTKSTSARSRTRVAKAAAISRPLVALRV